MLCSKVNIIWFSKEVYLKDTGLIPHTHDYYHYIYILKGKGLITVNGREYRVTSDDFLLTPINGCHSLLALSEEGLSVIEIKFNVGSKKMNSLLLKMKTRINMGDYGIRGKLESMVREGMNRDILYKEIIGAIFHEVLFILIRAAMQGESKREEVDNLSSDREKYGVLKDVFKYLNSNYSDKISLDMLAKSARMSKYHFTRVFKDVCGQTPMEYLNGVRIAKARELLMYSDFNVAQIGEKTGFGDGRYFSQVFKKKEGITPTEYLKNYRNNLYFHLNL